MANSVDNSFSEILNMDELCRIQKQICDIGDLACCCVDRSGGLLASYATKDFDLGALEAFASSNEGKQFLANVEDGSLEDIYSEDVTIGEVGERFHCGVVSVELSGSIMMFLLILGHLELPQKKFLDRLDFMKQEMDRLLTSTFTRFVSEAQSSKSQDSEADMQETIRTLEATTSVVSLLENSAKIEQLMTQWLQAVVDYLGVAAAGVLRANEDGKTVDILAEVYAPHEVSKFESKTSVDCDPNILAVSDAPLVLSTDAMNTPTYENLKMGDHMSAIMVFPLLRRADGIGNMMIVVYHSHKEHTWSMQEVKFTADAARVLQSVLVNRINKNSVASSFHAIEEILNNVGSSVFLTDASGERVLFVNRMLISSFEEEWKDGTLRRLIGMGNFENPEKGSFEIFYGEKRRYYDLLYKKLQWVDGTDAMLYSLYDITDRKLYQRKIEQQAFTDFLTGMYNRMCCERDLARLIDEAKSDGTRGALVYLDLDDFKHINDGLGHQYGDVLLKSISAALRAVPGIENTCYRMGGDEFVLLIPPEAFPDYERIVRDIREVFTRPWYLKDSEYYCTTSMGSVTFPDLGDSVPDLIRKADIAMYEAKKSGKNRMASYSEGQDSKSGRRLDMERNMRDAENNDYQEFEVYYQPIVDVENGESKCVGAEALVRWNSMRLGFVSPGDFIPLAEYLGLINPIGNHVLLEACKTCKSWNDQGKPDMKVNVNLSVVQLLQNDIVELVEKVLQETKLSPANLTLEVTESLAINDMPRMLGILSRIKELGVSIALDDFGTGYSSLNHIREIPFDVIKVDQSFVRDLAEDAYSQSFVKMVSELAETIGVKICVEGIETAAQMNVITGMKVKYIQGFFFDRPMPREKFEEAYVRS